MISTGFARRGVRAALVAAVLGIAGVVLLPGNRAEAAPAALVVNSPGDLDPPPAGVVTLRSAIRRVRPGGRITFAAALDGRTIRLSTVGDEHSVLVAETYAAGVFAGYQERDFGRSALYARKDLTIDASALPRGITLAWAGGDASRARVLAVYGDLTLKNVTLTGGFSAAEALPAGGQPFTLARGGGLATWGTARLVRCTIGGNRVAGDEEAARDRGAFGGGVYGDRLLLERCVVSGNTAIGYGAAGGGVYSVGGADLSTLGSSLDRCAVTGNRVTGQHAYGGGVFSAGGGQGNVKTLALRNCTIARNLVEDHAGLDEPAGSQFYYRGGGVYFSNGSLSVRSSTIVENTVTGHPASFNGKPNMGGGGVAATIGNAHVVEALELRQSIVAGNSVGGAADDVYTGSLISMQSLGYNLVGALDCSQILVPAPAWATLSRKHWPAAGDRVGVAAAAVLDLGRARTHRTLVSAGTDAGAPALVWAPPAGEAVDRVPVRAYPVAAVGADYTGPAEALGALLNGVVARVRADHASELGADFGSDIPDQAGIVFVANRATWPSDPLNAPWIAFWRDLDARIAGRLGPAGLNDAFWTSLAAAPGGENVTLQRTDFTVGLPSVDQRGQPRPAGRRGDVGAIER
jgi:hypothetical protein